MNYIMIRTDDMLNGEGLRVVLFCTACNHKCKNCHNPETWNKENGKPFDETAEEIILNELSKDYISGITFSGGDPLHENNVFNLYLLCKNIKRKFPEKTIWIYTGYKWEDIFKSNGNFIDSYRRQIISESDVLVDGLYIDELADINYPWAGSTNQRVIDVKKTLEANTCNPILYQKGGI